MGVEYGDGTDSNLGRIIQVVSENKVGTASVSLGGGADGIIWSGPSITMSDSNNKVLVIAHVTLGLNSEQRADAKLVRGSTDLAIGSSSGSRYRSTAATNSYVCYYASTCGIVYLDAPGSGTHQYKISVHQGAGGGGRTVYLNRTGCDTDNSEYSRYSSTITAMEVAHS